MKKKISGVILGIIALITLIVCAYFIGQRLIATGDDLLVFIELLLIAGMMGSIGMIIDATSLADRISRFWKGGEE